MDKIRVGCAVVAVQDGRILLGRRGKEPMYGKWIIPGGGIGLFEHYADTAIREFREETGLTIFINGVEHVAEIIVPGSEHRVVIYVSAEVVGGSLQAGSDLLEVRRFTRAEVAILADSGELTPTVQGVLKEIGWLNSDAWSTAAPRKSRRNPNTDRRATFSVVNRLRKRVRISRRNRSIGGIQLQLF